MPRPRVRNHVVAGLFLMLMAAAVVAILVLVGNWGRWLEPAQRLRIRFAEAPNIKIGSPVQLAGHRVGRIEDVYLREVPCEDPARDEPCYVVETIAALPSRYRIFQNARVVIQQSLVGQLAVINFEATGFGEPVGEFLEGGQASPFAAAADELGIGAAEKKNIQEILASLRTVLAGARESIPEVLAKLKDTAANMAEVTGALKKDFPDLREKLAASATNINEASQKAKVTLAKVEAVLDENRENIKKTTDHAAGLAEKADRDLSKVLANAAAASEDLKTAVADFRRLAADSKELVATNKTHLDRTLKNFRSTSEHLNALAQEVRRSPWRLFTRPDKKEVESLNLYDAARAFASAATDLETLADTLQAMIEAKQEGIDVDPELLKGMLQRLEQTFQNYSSAEEALCKEFERIQK